MYVVALVFSEIFGGPSLSIKFCGSLSIYEFNPNNTILEFLLLLWCSSKRLHNIINDNIMPQYKNELGQQMLDWFSVFVLALLSHDHQRIML